MQDGFCFFILLVFLWWFMLFKLVWISLLFTTEIAHCHNTTYFPPCCIFKISALSALKYKYTWSLVQTSWLCHSLPSEYTIIQLFHIHVRRITNWVEVASSDKEFYRNHLLGMLFLKGIVDLLCAFISIFFTTNHCQGRN